MFAIRGAVRVEHNEPESVLEGTRRLLRTIVERNGLVRGRIVAAHFTMTPDLDAAFPAAAARELGWSGVPMLGAQETAVPGAPDRMLRVLLLVEGEGEARHVYLGEADRLRPDLAEPVGDAGDGELGRLLVVGLGLIGGSAALALRRSGRFEEVVGVDLWEEVVRKARALGVVDRGTTEPEAWLEEADVVLLAVPVDRIPDWLDRWSDRMAPGAVVTDVGSTKRGVAEAMAALPEHLEAVGGHPLAGCERRGVENARADLFRGSSWALVETARTGERARSVAESLVGAVGARPVWVEAEAHDRAVAATSHLPYLVSSALARRVDAGVPEGAGTELRGPGIRDMVRLARTPSRMMAGVIATNWPEVRRELTSFEAGLAELRRRLDAAVGDPSSPARDRVARVEHGLLAGEDPGGPDDPESVPGSC